MSCVEGKERKAGVGRRGSDFPAVGFREERCVGLSRVLCAEVVESKGVTKRERERIPTRLRESVRVTCRKKRASEEEGRDATPCGRKNPAIAFTRARPTL